MLEFHFQSIDKIYRIIYTCALNESGGVEGDYTVTILEPGNGSPVSPSFEVIFNYTSSIVVFQVDSFFNLTNGFRVLVITLWQAVRPAITRVLTLKQLFAKSNSM